MSASERLKALNGAATSAPWATSAGRTEYAAGGARYVTNTDDGERFTHLVRSEADAFLIAALRNALPQIVALVEAAEGTLDSLGDHPVIGHRLRAALTALEEALS